MKPPAGDRLGRQARGEKVPSAFTVISHSMPSGASTMVYGFGIVSTSRRKGRDIAEVEPRSVEALRISPTYPIRRGGYNCWFISRICLTLRQSPVPGAVAPATWGHSIRRDRAY
jgi:hypothetical protein